MPPQSRTCLETKNDANSEVGHRKRCKRSESTAEAFGGDGESIDERNRWEGGVGAEGGGERGSCF